MYETLVCVCLLALFDHKHTSTFENTVPVVRRGEYVLTTCTGGVAPISRWKKGKPMKPVITYGNRQIKKKKKNQRDEMKGAYTTTRTYILRLHAIAASYLVQ